MSDNSEVITGKMVLVGEMAVGKSNMVSQYVKAEFHDEYISTNGASFDHKTLFIEEYNKTLNMHIWDTAGQERFRALSRIFYKDAKAAILVYDVTRRGTFEELKNYWHKEMLNNAPEGIALAVAANKSDLVLDSQVPESEGIEFAKSIGAIFRTTSAKTGDGIEDLFYCMGKKMIKEDLHNSIRIDPIPQPKPIPNSCC